MDKELILSVAGSGKTYKICESINLNQKNLIIAFTNQNIKNIRNELIKIYGIIPEKTRVMTFHSFLYRFYILPYEIDIFDYYNIQKIKTKGVTFNNPPEKPGKPGIYNPNYIKDIFFQHYVSKNNYYYCSLMSKLLVKTGCAIKITKKLNYFFDKLLIDEFQDFRDYDYKFLSYVIKNFNNILLVGDYYQHSVSGRNNSGKPFNEINNIDEYKIEIDKLGININDKSLSNSRRCPKNICNFVRKKLMIKINENNNNFGNVIFLTEKKDIKNVLDNNSIIKLIEKNSKKFIFNSINWGYSKGDTYDNICVILTEKFDSIDKDDFDFRKEKISEIMRNKIYVAFTRTKGNLYIIKKRDFELAIK